jgi:hypothetical protein
MIIAQLRRAISIHRAAHSTLIRAAPSWLVRPLPRASPAAERRQVFRLLRGLKQDGATSLLSKHRGKPSNHRLPAEVR